MINIHRELWPDFQDFVESLGYSIEGNAIQLKIGGNLITQYFVHIEKDRVHGLSKTDLLLGAYLKRPDYYVVPSFTHSGLSYAVYVGKQKACTCPDFTFTKSPCKHILLAISKYNVI